MRASFSRFPVLGFLARFAVAAALCYALSANAGESDNKQPYSTTAMQLSRAVIAGIRVGAEIAQNKQQISEKVSACVRGIDDYVLAGVYDRLMRERLSAEQIRTLDAFYGSEAGHRFYRWTLNELRKSNNLEIIDPIELSAEEQSRADALHAEGPGKILNDMTSDADADAAATLKREIEAVVTRCTS